MPRSKPRPAIVIHKSKQDKLKYEAYQKLLNKRFTK